MSQYRKFAQSGHPWLVSIGNCNFSNISLKIIFGIFWGKLQVCLKNSVYVLICLNKYFCRIWGYMYRFVGKKFVWKNGLIFDGDIGNRPPCFLVNFRWGLNSTNVFYKNDFLKTSLRRFFCVQINTLYKCWVGPCLIVLLQVCIQAFGISIASILAVKWNFETWKEN
jgi:hypothetical protein